MFQMEKKSFCGLEIRDVDLSGFNLENVDFSFCKLQNSNFTNCVLDGSKFVEADLTDCIFQGAHCTKVDFTKANLTRVNLSASNLVAANLTEANLTKAKLDDSDLRGSRFEFGRGFEGCTIDNSTFSGTIEHSFPIAKFSKVTFMDTTFKGCDRELLEKIFAQKQFEDCKFFDLNLNGMDLKDMFRKEVTFKDCKMIGVSFKDTVRCYFTSCDLTGAHFVDSNFLKREVGYTTSWEGNNFSNAKFQRCNLSGCYLGPQKDNNFSGAVFENCEMGHNSQYLRSL